MNPNDTASAVSVPSPAAVRQRRLRERRRRGARIIHVEIDDDLIAAFDELGFVDLSEKDAVGAVSFAISMLLAEAIEARRI